MFISLDFANQDKLVIYQNLKKKFLKRNIFIYFVIYSK